MSKTILRIMTTDDDTTCIDFDYFKFLTERQQIHEERQKLDRLGLLDDKKQAVYSSKLQSLAKSCSTTHSTNIEDDEETTIITHKVEKEDPKDPSNLNLKEGQDTVPIDEQNGIYSSLVLKLVPALTDTETDEILSNKLEIDYLTLQLSKERSDDITTHNPDPDNENKVTTPLPREIEQDGQIELDR